MIEPSSILPSSADFDRRAYLRSIAFWRPSDLSIHTGSLGDDYRGNLQCSEQVIFGLLLCHSVSPAFDTTVGTWTKGEGKCVSGERDPVTKLPVLRHVAYNSRQPIVLTLWDRGNGIVPWITDGRQRGRSSEGMGQKEAVGEMGAVEAINHRLKMIVELARELDPSVTDGATDHKYLPANELQIRVRNEAKMRSQKALAGDKAFKGWEWAKSGEIALYLGGKLGDEKSSQWQHGLIDWRSMADGGPVAAEFVCWTVFEPDDRDPATVETLIGSVVLRQAQVGDPPSVECKRTAAIVNKPDDPKFPGQGVPISVMARLFGVSRVTIQDRCMLLLLIPEVLDELDAGARGEDGLSMRQVMDGGFFHAGTGTDDVRIPKTRDEQLALIAKLKGTRGLGALREADLAANTADKTGSKESNGTRTALDGPARELGSGDSGLDRHAADEPRAPVGPDSPATAGLPVKAMALSADLARAVADKLDEQIEGLLPGTDGKLPSGEEATSDHQQERRQYEAVYQFLRLIAGDVSALQHDAELPAVVNNFRTGCRDSVEEVLRAHNLAIKPVGIASTVAVVDKAERAPAELSTGPRAAGGSRKPAGGAKGLSKKDRAAVAAGASVEKVKAEKVAAVKPVKVPKPAKVPAAPKPVKVATAKKEKLAKPLKEVKPAKVKPAKKEKAVKAPATPAT